MAMSCGCDSISEALVTLINLAFLFSILRLSPCRNSPCQRVCRLRADTLFRLKRLCKALCLPRLREPAFGRLLEISVFGAKLPWQDMHPVYPWKLLPWKISSEPGVLLCPPAASPYHYGASARRQSFYDIAGEFNAAIALSFYAVFIRFFGAVHNGGDLGHSDTRDNPL